MHVLCVCVCAICDLLYIRKENHCVCMLYVRIYNVNPLTKLNCFITIVNFI